MKRLAQELGPGWKVAHHQLLEKKYPFRNFREGLAFVNKVGALAEQEGHHPDIEISYTSVKVTLSTHKIHGLSHNDFILAAKIDLI